MTLELAHEIPPEIAKLTEIKRGQIWFRCEFGHFFGETLANVRRGRGCRVCRGLTVFPGQNDLMTTHPEIAKQWDKTKNNFPPSSVTAGSKLKVWWLCAKGHSWSAIINNRKTRGCPVCSHRATLQGFNDLPSTSKLLAHQFDIEKNESSPDSIRANENRAVWWLCELGHSWKQSPRIRNRGIGCPYCTNQRAWPGFNDLQSLFPEIASWWNHSVNGSLKPCDVLPGSNVKVTWLCPKGHEFDDRIGARVQSKGCPICLNRRLNQGFNDLQTRRPDLAAQWNYEKNRLTPSQVLYASRTKYWWICQSGHSWRIDPSSRLSGSGCPSCSKTGFKPEMAGRIYFIKNPELEARKVGITNSFTRTSRLDQFTKRGWSLVFYLDDDDGSLIQVIERSVIEWIRKEVGLGTALKKDSLGGMSGHTETFSIDGVSDQEVIEFIQKSRDMLTGKRAKNNHFPEA